MQLALFENEHVIDVRTLSSRLDPQTSADAVEALDASGGLNRQRAEVLKRAFEALSEEDQMAFLDRVDNELTVTR